MARVTIICPTHNRGQAILPTLDSVRRQTERDWTLLVVSDASDDDTDEVVRAVSREDRRVQLLRTDRRYGRPAGPTNLALAEARSELTAYIDHDDRWAPGHLQALCSGFDRGATFVGTRARQVDTAGRETFVFPVLHLFWHRDLQLLGPLLHNSSVGHTTELGRRAGGWREEGDGLEDWDLWLRFADLGATCQPVLDLTVDLLEDRRSRQHRLHARGFHEVARFDDGLSARRAHRILTDVQNHPRFHAALVNDLRRLYRSLDEAGELVHPLGWDRGVDEAFSDDGVDGPYVGAGRTDPMDLLGPRLVVERRHGHHVLGWAIPVMTAEHSTRFSAFYRATMTEQQAFLAEAIPEECLVT